MTDEVIFAYVKRLLSRPNWGQVTSDVIDLIGLAIVAVGVGMVFLPAGIITAGLAVCFVNYSRQAPKAGDGA